MSPQDVPPPSEEFAAALTAAEGEASRPDITCWRCHKQVAASANRCPHCEARIATRAAQVSQSSRRSETSPILSVCVAFAILLIVSILQGAVMLAMPDTPEENFLTRPQLQLMLGTGLFDTLVVVGALFHARGRIPPPVPAERRAWTAWCAAPFVLALALAMNVGYHALVRAFIAWPDATETSGFDPRDLVLIVLVLCVQPAIVEELFFRYLALGALRNSMGAHAAVWVSSVMFGMAHVGMPVSIPVLFVMGLVFGYARILSGGLALPMLMHFANNAAVLFLVPYLS